MRIPAGPIDHRAIQTPTSDQAKWAILVLVGASGGLLSGLFAVGGGLIMVPLLTTFARMDQREASATSLAAIVPTAVVGSVTYLLAGNVDLTAGALVSVGAVVGAIIGSALLRRIPLTVLRWMFIAFILLTAARLLLTTPVRGHQVYLSLSVGADYVALGLSIGVLAGLFGIGGGIIAVPALIALFGFSDLVAKGTSLAIMIPTSLVGTIANWRAGTVNVRAGLVIGIVAMLASIPGALVALCIPARLSRVLFGTLLLAVAAQLAQRARNARRLTK
jgi:uncharacterized membrane protein YfcA